MTHELDLNGPGVAKKVAREILDDIDRAAVEMHSDGHRKHLGASIIGETCYRKLWFVFRWVYNFPFQGRQLRLFNRGHLEEPRFTGWLQHAGYTVYPVDPATGNQWRVSSIGGHFGGSKDGIVYLPPKFNYPKPLLLEYKTNGTGPVFNKLIDKGVAIAKPMHFDQMSTYGYIDKHAFALYLNVCKNDDNIHAEIVKLDQDRGKKLEDKARVIILSQVPPPRAAENPAAEVCKYCDFKDVCYFRQPIEKNCRSCMHASAQDNKEWRCDKWSAIIPEAAIPAGCGEWTGIYKP